MENMKGRLLQFLFCLILTGGILVFSVSIRGEHLSFLESEAITVVQTQRIQPVTPFWSLLDKILEPDPTLENIQLKVGESDISYYEEKFVRDDQGNIKINSHGIPRRERVLVKDPEREIALKLLNIKTGVTEIVKITKKGSELIAPMGYDIEVVERLSGITWNAHNTYYKVNQPADSVVIKNAWPSINGYKSETSTVVVKGKKKKVTKKVPIVENKIYVPYSQGLNKPEITQKGHEDLNNIVTRAKETLRGNKVMSRAFPDRLVADVLPDEYYFRRAIMERTDLGEMILDGTETIDMFYVILATNGPGAFSSCNLSKACGMMQFTDRRTIKGLGTYTTVVRKFPTAGLIKDFKIGSTDQVNSVMAAILLDDLNLQSLVNTYGDKIYNDPRLEEYLASSYNGAPNWVFKSLNATLGKNFSDWTKHLRPETKGFMVKLRYLKDKGVPS